MPTTTSHTTSHTTPITCQDSVQLVSLLRDGELGASDKNRLALHLQGCSRCQTASQQFETLHLGLDFLLARPTETLSPSPSLSPAPYAVPKASIAQHEHLAQPTNSPRNRQQNRRQWLGWLTGMGLGGLTGAGAGVWWGMSALQTAQSPQDDAIRRITQYQALYVRETVAGAAIPSAQAQAVLQQWLSDAPQVRPIAAAPQLSAQGLQLVRAQRLALASRPVLQWVYLPQEGHPIALCGMALGETSSAQKNDLAQAQSQVPQLFTEAAMRGMHWRNQGVLWVLVAPQDTWTAEQLQGLQQSIAPQLA